MRRPRLSYANVVASLALFVALGGTSYAVIATAAVGVSAGMASAANITLQEGREISGPTSIRMRCSHDFNLPGTPRFDYAQLTAIRTNDLQVQPG